MLTNRWTIHLDTGEVHVVITEVATITTTTCGTIRVEVAITIWEAEEEEAGEDIITMETMLRMGVGGQQLLVMVALRPVPSLRTPLQQPAQERMPISGADSSLVDREAGPAAGCNVAGTHP
uniref:Uncharacterized protein n=1 Tax=Cacopsylla melanoneura TaxID=428564 RepID=A0A8D9BSP4_9HEMI